MSERSIALRRARSGHRGSGDPRRTADLPHVGGKVAAELGLDAVGSRRRFGNR
jgi:hypothetical protein